jgi:hypothetical protein
VLAVVAQEVVSTLAEPGARPLHDVVAKRHVRRTAKKERALPDELIERNFLDTAKRISTYACVMYDAARAGVDSMLSISMPAHDEPSSRHQLSIHDLTCVNVPHGSLRTSCVLDKL